MSAEYQAIAPVTKSRDQVGFPGFPVDWNDLNLEPEWLQPVSQQVNNVAVGLIKLLLR